MVRWRWGQMGQCLVSSDVIVQFCCGLGRKVPYALQAWPPVLTPVRRRDLREATLKRE